VEGFPLPEVLFGAAGEKVLGFSGLWSVIHGSCVG